MSGSHSTGTGVAVGGDHGGGPAVPFGDDLVEVGGLAGLPQLLRHSRAR